MKPLISSIVPVRQSGEEKALAATLSNLCYGATDFKVELVVCSDGPSDTNREVCEAALRVNKLSDEFNPNADIVYIELPEKTGHGSNPRNVALRGSLGDFVHFADAGTAYVRGFYQRAMPLSYKTTLVMWPIVVLRHPGPYIHNPLPEAGAVVRWSSVSGVQVLLSEELAKKSEWPTSYFCDRDYFEAIRLPAHHDNMRCVTEILSIAYGNLDNNDHHGLPFRGELELGNKYGWAR